MGAVVHMCNFQLSPSLTPNVTAVAGAAPFVEAGSDIVLTGEGFASGTGGVLTVMIGRATCTVTSHTDTEVQCRVGHGTYGSYVPTLTLSNVGPASVAAGNNGRKKRGEKKRVRGMIYIYI